MLAGVVVSVVVQLIQHTTTMALTSDQIFAAADDLDARGINPTLSAVRKALGTGSFTTISEAMSAWREKKSNRSAVSSEPLPDAVGLRLAELGHEVWSAALSQANARLTGEREALERAGEQADAERTEACVLADALTQELEQAKLLLTERDKTIIGLEATISAQAGDLAAGAERMAGLQARVDELLNRVQDLNAELERGHQRNAELSTALTALAAKGSAESKKPGEAGQ